MITKVVSVLGLKLESLGFLVLVCNHVCVQTNVVWNLDTMEETLRKARLKQKTFDKGYCSDA